MTTETEQKICSICQLPYEGFGNNADPINAGRCCDNCNQAVIVARINQLRVRTGRPGPGDKEETPHG